MQTYSQQNQGHRNLTYRPEIDGLRAIAVLSVIFFHLNATWLTGGFVGVDVFFVISGYLITSQIQKDIFENSFTLKNFYLRRIRRILPPLLTMLLATCIAALLILTPEDIRSFAKSLILQPLALQNFLFLSEGDYFQGADTKALMHTWSLAIEEQFYIFWPLLLIVTKKSTSTIRLTVVILLIISSFILNVYLSQSNPRTAFFMIFSRAWELALGGFAFMLEDRKSVFKKLSARQTEWISGISLAVLGFSFFYIQPSMSFPGKIALLPVVSTFLLIILTRDSKTIAGSILSCPLLVKIGLISYSLYLWHWPLLVFMHHLQINTAALLPLGFFWSATFGLAYASYVCIERPVRRKALLKSSRSLVNASGISLLACIIFGTHIMMTDGASYRYSEKAKLFLTAQINSRVSRCSALAIINTLNAPICNIVGNDTDGKKVLLWGNSHAGMWIPMLEKIALENNAALFLNTKNCRPISGEGDCNQAVQAKVMKRIQESGFTDVILASSWQGVAEKEPSRQLAEVVAWLANQNVGVWLVIDPPVSNDFDPLLAYAKNPQNPVAGTLPFEAYNRLHRAVELKVFLELQSRFPNIHVIDSTEVFCDTTNCYAGKGNEVWYRDPSHLNNAGALAAKMYFEPVFVTPKVTVDTL